MTLSRSTVLRAAALSVVVLSGCARVVREGATQSAAIGTADDLLRAMRERYDGRWYRTLTFVQRTTEAQANGQERKSEWLEAMAIPGRLRIDTDLEKGNGTLFARDSQFVVRENRLRAAVPGHNPLLVLGFDVYALPPARTAEILRGLGFQLGAVREDTWQGRPAYVVGGAPGDLHSHQFWVWTATVGVRAACAARGRATRPRRFEFRFNKYEPLAGWLDRPRGRGFVDGRPHARSRSTPRSAPTVRAPTTALFDVQQWNTAPHWSVTGAGGSLLGNGLPTAADLPRITRIAPGNAKAPPHARVRSWCSGVSAFTEIRGIAPLQKPSAEAALPHVHSLILLPSCP
jgi:hypothetical protein